MVRESSCNIIWRWHSQFGGPPRVLPDSQVSWLLSRSTLVSVCKAILESRIMLIASSRTKHRLSGLLDHEVGTHFTRAHNGRLSMRGAELAPKVSGFSVLATEEGIASLNTHQFFRSDELLPFLYARRRAYSSTRIAVLP